jgi:hypothetical protein
MKRQLIAVPLLIVLLAGAILLSTRTLHAAGKESPMLAHMVFFRSTTPRTRRANASSPPAGNISADTKARSSSPPARGPANSTAP